MRKRIMFGKTSVKERERTGFCGEGGCTPPVVGGEKARGSQSREPRKETPGEVEKGEKREVVGGGGTPTRIPSRTPPTATPRVHYFLVISFYNSGLLS